MGHQKPVRSIVNTVFKYFCSTLFAIGRNARTFWTFAANFGGAGWFSKHVLQFPSSEGGVGKGQEKVGRKKLPCTSSRWNRPAPFLLSFSVLGKLVKDFPEKAKLITCLSIGHYTQLYRRYIDTFKFPVEVKCMAHPSTSTALDDFVHVANVGWIVPWGTRHPIRSHQVGVPFRKNQS